MARARTGVAMIPLAFVLMAVAIVLSPGLDAWFVADDFWHLAYVRLAGGPLGSFIGQYFGDMGFRPMTLTFNFIFTKIAGDSAIAVHSVDMILHWVNVILVFVLGIRLFSRLSRPSSPEAVDDDDGFQEEASPGPLEFSPVLPALAGAVVFAVHPVTVSTAAWFCCRADLLATAFSLAVLIVAISPGRPDGFRTALLFVLMLCSLLCKVTHLPVFAAVFLLAFLFDDGPGFGARLKGAALTGLPVFAAACVCLAWRIGILGGLGGYGTNSDSLAGLFCEAWYNVPKVVATAWRDFVFHHMPAGHDLYRPLAGAFIVLVVLGGLGSVWRRRRAVLFGLGLLFLALLPMWNLAHMMSYREDRLLYLSMVGFSLLAGAMVAGSRFGFVRAACFGAVILIAAGQGYYSYETMVNWKFESRENHELARQIAAYIEPHGPASPVRRVYVLGLQDDSYYLDMIVKMELAKSYHDREFIPGDKPAFIWIEERSRGQLAAPKKTPAEALPKRQRHGTGKGMILETATPPDLILAAYHDPGARVLDWNGLKIKDVTNELRELYGRRDPEMSAFPRMSNVLPSFSFKKSPLPFDWKPSPNLDLDEPLHLGVPYTMTAKDNDPYLTSPEIAFPATFASRVEFDMKLPRRCYLPPGEGMGALSWQTEERPGFIAERTIPFTVIADGKTHRYKIDLASNIHWARSNTVVKLRLDPISYPTSFEIFRMEFLGPESGK